MMVELEGQTPSMCGVSAGQMSRRLPSRFGILMRRLLTFIYLVTLCARPILVGAQEPLYVESYDVSFWPEFDQAGVLVILRIQLQEDTSLPTTVDVTIPARVGDPFVVAKWDPTQGPDDRGIAWTRQEQGEWATIRIETDVMGVYLEYYDKLAIDGERRSYSFRLPSGIEMGAFRFRVQEPIASRDMLVSPAAEAGLQADGFVYHQADLGPQPSTASIAIDFSYNNPSGQLSTASIVRPEATQGRTPDFGEWIPYVIGGFGVLLLIFGATMYYRLQREGAERSPRRRRRGAPAKQASTRSQTDTTPRFCHQCGTKAYVGDNFCRSCGTKLRD